MNHSQLAAFDRRQAGHSGAMHHPFCHISVEHICFGHNTATGTPSLSPFLAFLSLFFSSFNGITLIDDFDRCRFIRRCQYFNAYFFALLFSRLLSLSLSHTYSLKSLQLATSDALLTNGGSPARKGCVLLCVVSNWWQFDGRNIELCGNIAVNECSIRPYHWLMIR